jgi:hypothetical protein
VPLANLILRGAIQILLLLLLLFDGSKHAWYLVLPQVLNDKFDYGTIPFALVDLQQNGWDKGLDLLWNQHEKLWTYVPLFPELMNKMHSWILYSHNLLKLMLHSSPCFWFFSQNGWFQHPWVGENVNPCYCISGTLIVKNRTHYGTFVVMCNAHGTIHRQYHEYLLSFSHILSTACVRDNSSRPLHTPLDWYQEYGGWDIVCCQFLILVTEF